MAQSARKNRKVKSFPGPTPDVTMISFGFNHRFYEFFFVEEFTDGSLKIKRTYATKGILNLSPPPTSIFTFLPSPQFSTDLTSFRDNSDLSIYIIAGMLMKLFVYFTQSTMLLYFSTVLNLVTPTSGSLWKRRLITDHPF